MTDQEASTRALIDFCDLPWDDRCLAFHELRNTVQTASVWQVRQPLYSGSVGRWQRFNDAFVAAFGPEVGVTP